MQLAESLKIKINIRLYLINKYISGAAKIYKNKLKQSKKNKNNHRIDQNVQMYKYDLSSHLAIGLD